MLQIRNEWCIIVLTCIFCVIFLYTFVWWGVCVDCSWVILIIALILAVIVWCAYCGCSFCGKTDDSGFKGNHWVLLAACSLTAVVLMCFAHIYYTAYALGKVQFGLTSIFSATDTVAIFVSIFTAIMAFAIFHVQERRAKIEGDAEHNRTQVFRQKLCVQYITQLLLDIKEKRNASLYKGATAWYMSNVTSVCIKKNGSGHTMCITLPTDLMAQNDFKDIKISMQLSKNRYKVTEEDVTLTARTVVAVTADMLQVSVEGKDLEPLMQCLAANVQQKEVYMLMVNLTDIKHTQLQVPTKIDSDFIETFISKDEIEISEIQKSISYEPLKYSISLEILLLNSAVDIDTIRYEDCRMRLCSCTSTEV